MMGRDGYKTLYRQNLERLTENVYLRVASPSWREKGARGKRNDRGKKGGRKKKETSYYTIACAILHDFFVFFGRGTIVIRGPKHVALE